MGAVAVAAALSALAACDRGDPKVDTTGAALSLSVTATSPKAGETDVPTDRPLRIRFDRHVLPSTAVRQSVRVTGGAIDADGGALAGIEFFEPEYDAIERVVTYRLAGGQKWLPGVRYTVTLWKPSERPQDGYGFRAWDGGELNEHLEFSFITATHNRVDTALGPSPNADYCGKCVDNTAILGAKEVFQRNCGYGTCHFTTPQYGAAVNLDLSTSSTISKTAIGRLAHETLSAPSSTEAPENPAIFGKNMPLIDPGNPGNSYVLWKMILSAKTYQNVSCDGGKTPATTCEPVDGVASPSAEDLVRMQNSFLMGEAMPLGFAVGWSDIQTMQAWIAAGAPIVDDSTCPDLTKCKASADAGVDGDGGDTSDADTSDADTTDAGDGG
ncbi:MAG: Ig-like domain-containing protein [Polyangiaceae bacterium]